MDKQNEELLTTLRGAADVFERAEAAEELAKAALLGANIEFAIPALWEALQDEMAWVSTNATRALTGYYLNNGQLEEIAELLEHPNSHVRFGTRTELVLWEVHRAVWRTGHIIQSTKSHLQMLLGCILGIEKQAFSRREYAPVIIWNYVQKNESLAVLDAIGRMMEKAYAKRLQRQSATVDAGELRRRTATHSTVTEILKKLAERKAQLAKGNDGELLTGETIGKPGTDRCVYRQIASLQCRVKR